LTIGYKRFVFEQDKQFFSEGPEHDKQELWHDLQTPKETKSLSKRT
jgi:hypothetical protein